MLKLGRDYGYTSDVRRWALQSPSRFLNAGSLLFVNWGSPKEVPKGAILFMEVELVRFEKEKNLHQMTTEEKIEFCKQ